MIKNSPIFTLRKQVAREERGDDEEKRMIRKVNDKYLRLYLILIFFSFYNKKSKLKPVQMIKGWDEHHN